MFYDISPEKIKFKLTEDELNSMITDIDSNTPDIKLE